MSLLAPWFLIGALVVGGPIIAHLIRRATRDRVPFSTTRFLEPSPPRLDRRNRIQHPWLLALRCLVVLVLCAGFARPFFRTETPLTPSAAVPKHVVVVVDESASMQRRGLWPAAVEKVRTTAASLGTADRFALLAVGTGVSTIISAERWTQTPPTERAGLIASVLATQKSGWGPTNLDTAIDAALEELTAMSEDTAGNASAKIIVVSDFAAGARVAGLAGRDWPRGSEVALERVETPTSTNASMHWLGWTTLPDGSRAARLRVSQDGATAATVKLQLRDASTGQSIGSEQSLLLAPRDSRVVPLSIPESLRAPLRVDLAGDSEPFDNSVWLVPPQARELTLPYVGAHTADDPQHALFYLTRAVEGSRDPIVHVRPIADAASMTTTSAPITLFTAPLDSNAVTTARARIDSGAFALVLLTDPSMVATAAALSGENGWTSSAPTRGDALLGQIDFAHPLFAPFADPRYSDFTHVRFWKPVPVKLPTDSRATVVARFDDGTPAVLECTVGKGRVIVWGGDWSPASSQWVLSTKFVPWLQALIERASGGPARPSVAEVGDAQRLASGPTARWRPLAAAPEAFSASAPVEPGVYQLDEEGLRRWIALQTPAIESRTEPLPLDTWEQLGVPMQATALTTASAASPSTPMSSRSAVTLENEQKLWRWLLIAAAVVLAIESLVAIQTARRYAPAQT